MLKSKILFLNLIFEKKNGKQNIFLYNLIHSPVEKEEKVVREVKLEMAKKPPNQNQQEQGCNSLLEEFIEF